MVCIINHKHQGVANPCTKYSHMNKDINNVPTLLNKKNNPKLKTQDLEPFIPNPTNIFIYPLKSSHISLFSHHPKYSKGNDIQMFFSHH